MIKENMRFNGVLDFYNRCDSIKDLYDELNNNEKYIYKYYVYSHRQIREYTCDNIWEILNAPDVVSYIESKRQLSVDKLRYKM